MKWAEGTPAGMPHSRVFMAYNMAFDVKSRAAACTCGKKPVLEAQDSFHLRERKYRLSCCGHSVESLSVDDVIKEWNEEMKYVFEGDY